MSSQSMNVRSFFAVLTSGLMMLMLPIAALSAEENFAPVSEVSVDRVDIANQQINLLKNRYRQVERELVKLQHSDNNLSLKVVEQAGKSLLDKAALDIAVSKSNLESINIELSDARQTVNLLNKNIREANNQLNVLKIFGSRIANSELVNVHQVHNDLTYQEKLIALEKTRVDYLEKLQDDAARILQIQKDTLSKLNAQLKSQRMMRIKQQEVRDELAYQEQQNVWMQKLDGLYEKLNKLNPVTQHVQYQTIEDEIFNASEHANYAYAQSLLARYRDQIHQLRGVVLKSTSIGQLNELNEQVDRLKKQMDKLNSVMSERMNVLKERIALAVQPKNGAQINSTLENLQTLLLSYQHSILEAQAIAVKRDEFRAMLNKAMHVELSERQNLPSFDSKTLIDIGKEILLVPALAFQVVKSLSVVLVDNIKSASTYTWSIFAGLQVLLLLFFGVANRVTHYLLHRPSNWREKINSKWLSLKWLDHHFIDLYVLTSIVGTMFIFNIPLNNYIFFVYLAGVWFVFKSIIVIARISLVETMNHTSDKDMRLYQRLKWIVGVGGVATATIVFIYQLPLIYELKDLADRLFLLVMMIFSMLLLRFWDVIPNLILSHMDKRHPYFEKSIWMLGVLVPLLLFANSVIGLLGYVNLVMSVSWYEGVFLIVLIGYLVLRGLLTDSVEQLSRVVIQHSSNGWLLTEAFLKPLDRILRLCLLFAGFALLFIFYGWNEQSPVVERMNALLHYPLGLLFNSAITPARILGLIVVISVFYWTAKWTREFVYRFLQNRTTDMGIRNSMAVLSQYAVIVLGIILSMQVLGIDARALAAVTAAFAFGVGLGLRDLANNFFCGFLILLERPVRVGDFVMVNEKEGEVVHIGSRAVTIMTWDHTAYVVPNTEIFNKSFINLTARDNVVRCIVHLKISRSDNPHQVQTIVHQVISGNRHILPDPIPEVFLKEMNDLLMDFELRFYVNIRQVRSRTMVVSGLLMAIWEAFEQHGIKPPYPQQEIFLRNDVLPAAPILSVDHLNEIIN